MKKRVLTGAVAITLAVILAVGLSSYLFFRVDAQGTLTGLEEKVTDKVVNKKNFRIVEIVPDGSNGEMGNLVKDTDQDSLEENMNLYLSQYLKEDASRSNTRELRQEYVNNLESRLLSYSGDEQIVTKTGDYEESYFPEDKENWKELKFSEETCEQTILKGVYEPDAEQKGNYEPNIESFQYSKDTGSYEVIFGTTMRADTEEPIYQQRYHVREIDENNNTVMELAGDDETENLYYIQSFSYKGSGNEGASYAPILETEKPYYYVEENGTYTFRPDDSQPETAVEIGKIYYRGGYESTDWLRTKVLASKDSAELSIETLTVTESELSGTDLSDVDFIYVCGDAGNSGKAYQSPEQVWNTINMVVADRKIPCMVDASTGVWEYSGTYREGYNGQADFVHENVYIFGAGDAGERQPFFVNFEEKIEDISGLAEVTAFVEQENAQRSGADVLSVDLTRSFLMQYIIDYSSQREVPAVVEGSLHILEVEPCDAYDADASGFTLTEDVLSSWTGVEASEITIDRMSSAMFIGKINDLNEDYDLIYFGANISKFNTKNDEGKETVYNDASMDGLIYSHTGDYILANAYVAGALDTDYAGAYNKRNTSNGGVYARNWDYFLYNNDALGQYTYLKNRTFKDSNGNLTQEFLAESLKVAYSYTSYTTGRISFNYINEVYGDQGVYRYSGNDITNTKVQEIMEFVEAKYPVVVADAFYSIDKSSINTSVIDNTSYFYQLLNQIKSYENVYTVSSAENGLAAYLNSQKPTLLYYSAEAPDDLQEYEGIDTEVGSQFKDCSKMVVDANNVLSVYFYIDSPIDADDQADYMSRLYLDADGNGNCVDSESIEEYSIYQFDTGAEAGKDEAGNYLLKSKTHYVLQTACIPNYSGILKWKLEVVQNSNGNIRISDEQYTKINGDEKTVKVLQIAAYNGENTTINLSEDNKIQTYLEQVYQLTGLKFEITTMDGKEFEELSRNSTKSFYESYLKGYDILVLGFSDMYYAKIPSYELAAIQSYVDSGKSVIFSHDIVSIKNNKSSYDVTTAELDWEKAGIDINWESPLLEYNCLSMDAKDFVPQRVLAMDRYGLNAADVVTSDNQMQSEFLVQGQHLTVNLDTLAATVNQCKVHSYNSKGVDQGATMESFATRKIESANLNAAYDIAYAANTSDGVTAQSYGQTHGLTYSVLNRFRVERGYTENGGKPYYNLKNSLLTGTNANESGIDEIEALVTKTNDGQITHYPFEIGTEFKAANTHGPYYQLHMDKDLDGDGRGDVNVWYCISDDAEDSASNEGKTYRNSTNDVRNNYYIYNVGNVIYTGMGHSALDHTGDDLETKLFINTMVTAVNKPLGDGTIEKPQFKFLETSESSSAEKKYAELWTLDSYTNRVGNTIYTYNDTVNADLELYFWVSDPNFSSGKKNIEVKFSAGGALTDEQIEIVDTKTNSPVTADSLVNNHVYLLKIKDIDVLKSASGSLIVDPVITATMTSSFDNYGEQVSQQVTKRLQVRRAKLLDLN